MDSITKAKKILKKLNECGYEAYIVGGYVRDFLLNITSNDIDITTNAKPEEIALIFNISKNGIDYSSVTIKDGMYSFEITTFRKDVSYIDHRHPQIELVDNVYLDIERRDFTINALLMDYNHNIVDRFDGIKDINNKIIRAINDPYKKINEDVLRILRGFYLVSKLEFDFEINTLNAIKDNVYLLEYLSKFRIISEMNKIIFYNKSNKVFKLMKETGCTKYLRPLDKGIDYILDNNVIINSRTLFYALCFYLNDSFDESYEFPKNKKRKIKEIISLTKNKMNKYDMINFEYDILSYANELRKILKLEYISNLKEEYDLLPIHSVKEVDISSIELMLALNKTPGEWLNFCFIKIAEAILEGKINNNKEEILSYIKVEEV